MKIQKTILCYGDSNTWGYFPCPMNDTQSPLRRYSRDERWTGLLQKVLGDEYYVIEEGLNARTTNIDAEIFPPRHGMTPLPINRNGMMYLLPCLYSHAPIDLVILALGGNDLKACYKRSAEDVKNGLSSLINVIQESMFGPLLQAPPRILILIQPPPLPICEQARDENNILIYEGMIEKAKLLISLFKELAKEKQCYFLDISPQIRPSEIDGIHYDGSEHKKISQLIYKKVLDIFK